MLFAAINTFVRGMIVDQVHDRFEQSNILMSRDIDDWLNRFKYLLDAKALMASYLPKDIFTDMAVALHKHNDDIAISFFSFTDEGTAMSSVYGGLPEEWELFTRPWYMIAIENLGQTMVQNPFWSIVEQTWATSISRTVTYLDGTEGVVSFTIKLDAVFEMMGNFEIEGGGYVFLIGEDSVIISHPYITYTPYETLMYLADFETYSAVLPSIMSQDNFASFVTEYGIPSYVMSEVLGSADWLMVSVVYASNINSLVNRLTTVVMITASTALIVLSVLVLMYVSKLIRGAISRSVSEFRESSASLAKGEGLKIRDDRDNSFGLNEVSREFDQNLTIMANIMDDLSQFSHEVGVNGDIEYRVNVNKYIGSFKEVIQSINDFADKFVDAFKQVMEQKEQVEISEANSQAKSRFLASMSHEIRTPMNAILGITEIQLHKSSLKDDVREAFEKIYVSGDMLLSIINDILDLSKIEAGKMELIIGKYESANIVNDTVVLNIMRIETKQIEFKVSCG